MGEKHFFSLVFLNYSSVKTVRLDLQRFLSFLTPIIGFRLVVRPNPDSSQNLGEGFFYFRISLRNPL